MSEVTKKSEKVTTTQARCSFSVGVTPHIMCSFIHYSRLHINILDTVGVIRNGTLVFVYFSAQDASILKISVPIIKRRSGGFQNTCKIRIILS